MRFTVPQFINYEAKVIGPFTFKQFIIAAVAGVICFAAFIKTPIYVYVPVFLIVGGGALGLIFVKPKGRTPVTMLKNFFFFTASPKVYVWKRKIIPTRIERKEEEKPEEKEKPKEATLKIGKGSKLKDLSRKIETSKK